MWAHLLKCKKILGAIDISQTTLSFQAKKAGGFEGEFSKELVVAKFSIERIRMALARMIIVDELPFRFVEHDGFICFMGVFEPRFPVPSHLMVARDYIKLWFGEREKLISYLKLGQRVSLTTNTWTSIQNVNYMCLTCHYIDGDWTYQKRILNFFIVPNHKWETIGKTIERCLNDWGIKMVITIIVDNAKSNNVALNYLKKKLEMKDGCKLGGRFLHMRCVAHILNLIVQEGLKGIHNSIIKVRTVVRYVKLSPKKMDRFKEAVKDEKSNLKVCNLLMSLLDGIPHILC